MYTQPQKQFRFKSQEDIEIVRFLEKSIPVKMLLVDNVSYAVDFPEDIPVVEEQLLKVK